jgi:tRNA-specific 2-thiouridylase
VKIDRLLRRAEALGFDAVATGHHARIVARSDGTRRVGRGADRAKDQSYVVHMLGHEVLGRLRFPVGSMTKAEVRAAAAAAGLATAAKPDSQDVCFITAAGGGRAAFLGDRIATRPGTVVDGSGHEVGAVPAVELITVGQRHGLGLPGGGEPRYAVAVDVPRAVVTVGTKADLFTDRIPLEGLAWTGGPVPGPLSAQTSAHGAPRPGRVEGNAFVLDEPGRRVAPGQSLVLYDGDEVVGGATCA